MQVVVHHGEHTLLHLAAVPGIQDNLLTGGKVEENGSLGVETELLVVLNLCLGSVVYNEIGLEACKLLSGRRDEHVLYEMCLPSNLHNETDCHAGILVRAAEQIHNVKLLAGELIHSQLLASVPSLNGSGLIVVLERIGGPPNGVLGSVVHNDELILGGTSGVDTGHNVHCAKLGYLALLKALKRRISLGLEQLLVRGVVYDLGRAKDAILCQIECFHFLFSFSIFYFFI